MKFARAALDGLSGVSEWKWDGVWSQSAVNKRWSQIGAPSPAPLLPVSMEGAKMFATRGPRMLVNAGTKKPRHVTAEENDFWNYFMKVASDPFRKSSGISNAAGVVLQVASAALPVFGYIQAVAAAGNYVTAKNAVKTDANLAARVMAPAYSQQAVNDQAIFDVQLNKLKSLAPKLASPAAVAQKNFASASVDAVVHPKSANVSPVWVWMLGAALGVVILARARA